MIAGMVDHGPGVSDRSINVVKKSLLRILKKYYSWRGGDACEDNLLWFREFVLFPRLKQWGERRSTSQLWRERI